MTLTKDDARRLLDFINVYDKEHLAIEPEIVAKLKRLAGESVD